MDIDGQRPATKRSAASSLPITVRPAKPDEYGTIGKLMVEAYSQLEGFPKPSELPHYYGILANVGDMARLPEAELLVAVSSTGDIGGAVVYLGDMRYYGQPGRASTVRNASGFRLLAVDPAYRGQGMGRLLMDACIDKAVDRGHEQVVIHTTEVMQPAWKMYVNRGFRRSEDLDFMKKDFRIMGFRLLLDRPVVRNA